MPAERLSMRKTQEILRLKFGCGLSNRDIAKSVSVGRSTIGDYLLRAKAAGLSWPLPEGMDETSLERLLFPSVTNTKRRDRPLPVWPEVHSELKRKGVTLALLWQEYKEKNSDGYQYSWFCQNYERWHGTIDLVMRHDYLAGEKVFVDYAGQTVDLIDQRTGEVKSAQVFVAVLGASNYTYAEATWTQALSDWIGSHVRAFASFGGVPEVVVPDNLKSGVTKANYYEPDINPTYQDMASHYGLVVLPARVRERAKLRQSACLEDIDYRQPRGLDKSLITKLADCQWISNHQNLILTGPTGVGKSYLACAFAQKACRGGFNTVYARMSRLFEDLSLAKGDGRYIKMLAGFAKTDLLVLDDYGLAKLNREQRHDLLEILEDRHGVRSTLVTSQLPLEHWHEQIGDPTLADAILDRLVHNAHKIQLKGGSMRKNNSNLTD